jgi:sucrose phosphorylase
MRNQVQLITYPDRLAGDLPGLRRLLSGPMQGLFGGVHVLPFYRTIDGADAGFDPIDHREVDPRVGSWDDLAALAGQNEVCADLIVNHVSDASPWFIDLTEHGDASRYAGMFLTFDSVFPNGATEADLMRIYRPRPGLPFTVKSVAGQPRLMWTTFTGSQIDIDVNHPAGWEYLLGVLDLMQRHGVRCVRLDAVGYAVKTPDTNCFMTPQTFQFISELSTEAGVRGLEVLVEVHSYYRHQIEIAAQVDLVYDFALPPLVLHALHSGDVDPLLHWLQVRPQNAITVLDTHDGIGVVDVGPDQSAPARPGLLSREQLSRLVEDIHQASRGVSRQATGTSARNLDVYQVNCTWYDAVGRDDARMLLSRLIQLFTPGIPQVYYVGLLAGGNDVALLSFSGNGRDVNRHYFQPEEIATELRRPVVTATAAAIRLRNTHPAFGGSFSSGPGPTPGSLTLAWQQGADQIRLEAVPGQASFELSWTEAGSTRTVSLVQQLADLTRDGSQAGMAP